MASKSPPTAPGARANCSSCNAPVIWLAHTRTKRLAPINAEPVVGGNITINQAAGTYAIVGADARVVAREAHIPLHTNHFLDCPQAHAWHKSNPAPKGKESTHAE